MYSSVLFILFMRTCVYSRKNYMAARLEDIVRSAAASSSVYPGPGCSDLVKLFGLLAPAKAGSLLSSCTPYYENIAQEYDLTLALRNNYIP